jgi:anionic cell wall polymer biosynthesis LytR-Cps2A-Psr (LCP) family protein
MVYKTIADGPEYDIDLKKGFQHLDGNKALQYVRFRHDATSDFTRTERQRAFLKVVADKLIQTTSIIKLPNILAQVTPYIETNMSVNDMWKLASVGYNSSMSGSEQIPPMDLLKEETTSDGSQVIGIRSENKLKQFVQDTLNGPEPTPTPTSENTSNSSSTETH